MQGMQETTESQRRKSSTGMVLLIGCKQVKQQHSESVEVVRLCAETDLPGASFISSVLKKQRTEKAPL